MSDDFRIYGRGSGQGAYRDQKGEDLARFKRSHKTGDMVSGIFIRLEAANPGTAWINFDGAMLLAGLPPELASMAVLIFKGQGTGAIPTGMREEDFPLKHGDACYFVLEAINPEPVLRMLSLGGGGKTAISPEQALEFDRQAALRRSVFALPLPQIAARYSQKRHRIDSALHERLWTVEDLQTPFPATLPEALVNFNAMEADTLENAVKENWRQTQMRYTAFVQAEKEIAAAYSELNLYRAALHEHLRPYGLLGFFYTPWLCPPAKGMELMFYEPARFKVAPPSALAGSALAGVHYKLQGGLPDSGTGILRIHELSGIAEHPGARFRLLGPDEPDILRFLIYLKPQTLHSGFSRKA